MLYGSNVRKNIDAVRKPQSRSSNGTASSETFSLIGANVSDDDYKSDKSQTYPRSPSTQYPQSSKSETIKRSSDVIAKNRNRLSTSQLRLFGARNNSENSTASNVLIAEEKEEDDDYNKLTFKLRNTFVDVIESSSFNPGDSKSNMDMIDTIKSQLDTQAVRIRRLERALREKEDQLIKTDDEDTLEVLLDRYPNAMELYRKQIEEDQFNERLETCIEEFEAQRQKMILEHQRNFEILKLKYRNRFDDIVERMISDPSRLNDEWAKRVQREADHRVEEIKKKYSKR